MLTTEKLKSLLRQGENRLVDFKESHYFNEDGSEIDKNKPKLASFIKDILSFVNTIRTESAYLIIGIVDKTKEVAGVSYQIEARLLQNQVKNKCNLIPRIEVYPFQYEGKQLSIIEIPVSKYPFPCVPQENIKPNFLEKNRVYYRFNDENCEADQLQIKEINRWLDSLDEGLSNLPTLEFYKQKVARDCKNLQDFFVHLRGKQIVETVLMAKEIGATSLNVRENTVEKLCEELLQNERCMIVVGEPGMGKSTALQYLTQKLVQKFDNFDQPSYMKPLPVYLELRSLDESVMDLIVNALENSFVNIGKKTLTEITKKLLQNGALILFFDGLNEIIKDKNQKIVGDLKDFFKKYDQCMYVISSRPEESRKRLQQSQHIPTFELLPMDEQQQSDFLEKNCSEQTDKDLIYQTQKIFPDLQTFTGVPFLFFLLIRVVETNKKVPSTQTEIIKQFLYGLFDLEIDKNSAFDKEKAVAILVFLAFSLMQNHENNPKISYLELAEYIKQKAEQENWKIEIKEWIAKTVELQILSKDSEDYYGFRHQLFLESLYSINFGQHLKF